MMRVDLKCDNTFCKEYGKLKEYLISPSQLNKLVCPTCKVLLIRVWNAASAIRTSDGYKG